MTDKIVVLIETEVCRTILFCGVYSDLKKACGEALLEVDAHMNNVKSNYHLTSLCDLEADAGFYFDVIEENPVAGNLKVLILNVDNSDESDS